MLLNTWGIGSSSVNNFLRVLDSPEHILAEVTLGKCSPLSIHTWHICLKCYRYGKEGNNIRAANCCFFQCCNLSWLIPGIWATKPESKDQLVCCLLVSEMIHGSKSNHCFLHCFVSSLNLLVEQCLLWNSKHIIWLYAKRLQKLSYFNESHSNTPLRECTNSYHNWNNCFSCWDCY